MSTTQRLHVSGDESESFTLGPHRASPARRTSFTPRSADTPSVLHYRCLCPPGGTHTAIAIPRARGGRGQWVPPPPTADRAPVAPRPHETARDACRRPDALSASIHRGDDDD